MSKEEKKKWYWTVGGIIVIIIIVIIFFRGVNNSRGRQLCESAEYKLESGDSKRYEVQLAMRNKLNNYTLELSSYSISAYNCKYYDTNDIMFDVSVTATATDGTFTVLTGNARMECDSYSYCSVGHISLHSF